MFTYINNKLLVNKLADVIRQVEIPLTDGL